MKNISFDRIDQFINNIHIDVLEHGYLYGDQNWNYPGVTSPFNRIYFMLRGVGCIRGEGKKTELFPGRIYLIPLQTTNDYVCESSMEIFYIHFRTEIFPGIDAFETLKEIMSLPFDRTGLEGLLEKVRKGELSGIYSLKAHLFDAVFRFLENAAVDLDCLMASSLKYRRVSQFMDRNCSMKLTPESIAQSLGIPQDTLARDFAHDMGYSLKSCISNTILQHAKEKLLLTDMRIKEIAYSFNFCDEFHFSHFFKKHTGASPREYRRKNRIRL